MKFLITGKAGLIGKKLVSFLIKNNHEISILTRNWKKINSNKVNGINDLESINKYPHFNAIINLVGASIRQRREHKAMKGENYRIKVYIIRLGLVLCKNCDALEKILPPFKFGLGSNNEYKIFH